VHLQSSQHVPTNMIHVKSHRSPEIITPRITILELCFKTDRPYAVFISSVLVDWASAALLSGIQGPTGVHQKVIKNGDDSRRPKAEDFITVECTGNPYNLNTRSENDYRGNQ